MEKDRTLYSRTRTIALTSFATLALVTLLPIVSLAEDTKEEVLEKIDPHDKDRPYYDASYDLTEKLKKKVDNIVDSQDSVPKIPMLFRKGNTENAIKNKKKKDYESAKRMRDINGGTVTPGTSHEIIGACVIPGLSWTTPYIEYYTPWGIVEVRAGKYGGEYIERKTAKEQRDIHLGKKNEFSEETNNQDKDGREYKSIYELASAEVPMELNKLRAYTLDPDGKGGDDDNRYVADTKDDREENLEDASSGDGYGQKNKNKPRFKDIPDVPRNGPKKITNSPLKDNMKEDELLRGGQVSSGGLHLDVHFIPEIDHHGDRNLPPGTRFSQHHTRPLNREEALQRTDVLPYSLYSSFESYSDLLFAQEMEQVRVKTPGHCQRLTGHSLPAAILGKDLDDEERKKYGVLDKIAPGNSTGSYKHCFKNTFGKGNAGRLYPMTRRVEDAGGSPLNAALKRVVQFHMLRDKLYKKGEIRGGRVADFNYHSVMRFPFYGYLDEHPPDKIEILSPLALRAKKLIGTGLDPRPAKPIYEFLEHVLDKNLSTEIDPIDKHRVVFRTWKYVRRCVPPGLFPTPALMKPQHIIKLIPRNSYRPRR